MRAIRNTTDGISILDVEPIDGSTMNDPVVVRPVSVGICGSDLHVIGLGMQGVTLGHEIAGTHNGRPVCGQRAWSSRSPSVYMPRTRQHSPAGCESL